MASFTGGSPAPSTIRTEAVTYTPLMPGSGGSVDPKRYILTASGWVAIQ